jgi:hypothetical protein
VCEGHGVSRLAGASQLALHLFQTISPRLDSISANTRASTAASFRHWTESGEGVWLSICIYQEATDPMHIQAGNHAVDDNDRSFQAFKDGEGERYCEHAVKFEQPFEEVPQILVALNHLDVESHTALRLSVTAEKISASGFTLRYSTWANTQVFGVGAQWIAFHEALSDFRLTRRIL